jgi:outer membrane protein OmpA-like peptidoglycan-associated protein/ribosomal protein L24E
MKFYNKYLFFCVIISFLFFPFFLKAQVGIDCEKIKDKRAIKLFKKAVDQYKHRKYSQATILLEQSIDKEPELVDAHFLLGLINFKKRNINTETAKKHFLKVIELCPSYDIYTYYYLGDIAYGAEEYENACKYLKIFLNDVDKIKSDKDYDRAEEILKYAKFYDKIYKNPVPFNPVYVKGISTSEDEYLPIITPDDDMALFTRKVKILPRKTAWVSSRKHYKEIFMYSEKENGKFDKSSPMPQPFNLNDNEGGATLTADSRQLFYTVCSQNKTYLNCDIFYAEFNDYYQEWSSIEKLDTSINKSYSWESQPSISSDGKILFFVSDRKGGYGGYDIYKSVKDKNGKWTHAENLGPVINTSGNEKSPFIHTDSRTLYFSSDGLMGIGGYDIFFSKIDKNGKFGKPKNIGYPINTKDDEVGFFVSTDGHLGYFASNKLNGPGGWDLYSFELYKEARPERVFFQKGELKDEKNNEPVRAKIELKNIATKKVTEIPVDTLTGKYVIVALFDSDFIMTVKKENYAYESKYISKKDTNYESPDKVDINIKQIQAGESYKLNDIYFATDSFKLTNESMLILDGFIEFLKDNPNIKIVVYGHSDIVGTEQYNLSLSENRAKSVYNYLVNNGINVSRLRHKGFGRTRPVASNKTESGRAKNRRTEFFIISK